jgi:hypothetical protein
MRVSGAMGACAILLGLLGLAPSFAPSVMRLTLGGLPPSRAARTRAPRGVNIRAHQPSAFHELAGPFSTRPSLAVSR